MQLYFPANIYSYCSTSRLCNVILRKSHKFLVHSGAKLASGKLFGSILHVVLMWKLTLVKYLWDSLINIFLVTINTISFSTEITSNYFIVVCLTWTMSSGNIILKLWKTQHHVPPKRAIAVEREIALWMATIFLNALFTMHLLVQPLIKITMVLVKILSKNVAIIMIVLLEINLVKRTLNCPSKYGNWKRKILIILVIGILLWNRRNMFVALESVLYVFVSSSLFQEQILMFCSINVMSLCQNSGIEINLLWSVLKIHR